MFNKYKKIIEKIVDIKSYLNFILLNLLVILFPLNQQYHFRPYPSVDGFIIDYLILKVSIPEILVVLLLTINFNECLKIVFSKEYFKVISAIVLFFLVSILRSNYPLLAIYENILLLSCFDSSLK